jgi:hypothetical protein
LELSVANPNAAADRPRIATEAALPKSIADDSLRMLPDLIVDRRLKEAP